MPENSAVTEHAHAAPSDGSSPNQPVTPAAATPSTNRRQRPDSDEREPPRPSLAVDGALASPPPNTPPPTTTAADDEPPNADEELLLMAVDIVETRGHLSVYLDPDIADPERESDRLDAEADHGQPWYLKPRWNHRGQPNPDRVPPPLPPRHHAPGDPTPPGSLPPVPPRTGRGRPPAHPVYHPVGIWAVFMFLILSGKSPTIAAAFRHLWETFTPRMLTIVGMPDLHAGDRNVLFRVDKTARHTELARLYQAFDDSTAALDDTPAVDLRHRQRRSILAAARARARSCCTSR